MKTYDLKKVWLCELLRVTRRRCDEILSLIDISSKTILIEIEKSEKTADSNQSKKYESNSIYVNLKGEEFFDGLTKGVYRPSDIGKVFVYKKSAIPKKYLTTLELEKQEVSEDRLQKIERLLENS